MADKRWYYDYKEKKWKPVSSLPKGIYSFKKGDVRDTPPPSPTPTPKVTATPTPKVTATPAPKKTKKAPRTPKPTDVPDIDWSKIYPEPKRQRTSKPKPIKTTQPKPTATPKVTRKATPTPTPTPTQTSGKYKFRGKIGRM